MRRSEASSFSSLSFDDTAALEQPFPQGRMTRGPPS